MPRDLGSVLSALQRINAETFTTEEISQLQMDLNQWMTCFLGVYQSRHVTPYMHAFVCNVPEFLTLYGNITQFTQQGMEKLNDVSTKYYFRATNHHRQESLAQLLLKRNRIEELEDKGNIRQKRDLHCSLCKQCGHNKSTCPGSSSTEDSTHCEIVSVSNGEINGDANTI